MTMTLDRPQQDLWFDLNADQKAILGPLREFLTAEVAPGAVTRDKTGEFPLDIVNSLATWACSECKFRRNMAEQP